MGEGVPTVFDPSAAVSTLQSAAAPVLSILVVLILISIAGGVTYWVLRVLTK